MRTLLLALALLCALRTSAQCCCGEQIVEVFSDTPMHSGGTWHYRADLSQKHVNHWSMDSVSGNPNAVRLRMPTDCGIQRAMWKLTSLRTGELMVIHLYHLPGDKGLPLIRLPFAGSRVLHFDLRELQASAATCGSPGGKYHTMERICNTGRVRLTFDGGRYIRFEPLELEPWTKEPRPPVRYTQTQEARYLDGPVGMQQYLVEVVGKARIAALPGKITFTGVAVVEANGMVNEVRLDQRPYTEMAELIRNALYLSRRWQPAVIERPSFPEGPRNFQAIRHIVPVQFVADPASVWGTIADFSLSVLPTAPTAQDSLLLLFTWFAGSCGSYRDSVVISPPSTERPWTNIAVGIGLVGADCTDIAMNRRTIVLPPQPPGTYHIHFGAAPASTFPIHADDPFVFREVVVQ